MALVDEIIDVNPLRGALGAVLPPIVFEFPNQFLLLCIN